MSLLALSLIMEIKLPGSEREERRRRRRRREGRRGAVTSELEFIAFRGGSGTGSYSPPSLLFILTLAIVLTDLFLGFGRLERILRCGYRYRFSVK